MVLDVQVSTQSDLGLGLSSFLSEVPTWVPSRDRPDAGLCCVLMPGISNRSRVRLWERTWFRWHEREDCEAGDVGLAICNMEFSESIGWQVASEAWCWKSNLGPTGMAQVESRKRCPKGWKPGSSQAQVPSQCEIRSPGRGGGVKSAARTRKTCSYQPLIHITHTGLKQVRLSGFKAEMVKLPEDSFQPS